MGKTLAIISSPSSIPQQNHRPEMEEAHTANQDVTDCLPKLFELSIVAVLVNENKICFGDFSKKAENHF